MKENVVRDKSFEFALSVIDYYKVLIRKKEYVMSKQMLRSDTAIGALIRESEHAESRADFIHKLSIALKEANETDYWIDLLHRSGYIEKKEFELLKVGITELLKLLTSILKTSKNN